MENIAKVLIDGGSTGLALSLLFYIWQRDKMFNKTMNNHLQHTEMAFREESKAKIELATTLSKLCDKIDLIKK